MGINIRWPWSPPKSSVTQTLQEPSVDKAYNELIALIAELRTEIDRRQGKLR